MKKHWFWGSISFSFGLYVDVLLASFLLNLFMLATPLFTMNVYDRVVPNSAFDTLWVFVVAILLVYLFDALMRILRTYTLEVIAKKSDMLISSRLFTQVVEMKLSTHFSSVGAFASHLREYDSIRAFFTASSMVALIDLPFLVIFLGVIWFIGGEIVAVPLFASALILLYSFLIKYPLKKSIEKVSLSSTKKNALLIESLNSLESIKSFSLQSQMQWRWEASVGTMAKDEVRSRLLSNSLVTFSNLVIQLSTVGLLVLGVYAISEQRLTMGGLIALVMLTSRTLAPLNQFTALIINYEQAKSAYRQLEKIMNLPVDNTSTSTTMEQPILHGTIEFQNVRFKYPNAQNYILDGVSFKIEAGENVGIIGTNGSGKSTIFKLLMGLYEPQSGTILIDGLNMAQYSRKSLAQSLAYLPQEIVLFRGTLAENIRNSVEDLSDNGLILSAKLSGIEPFIAQNSMGYNLEIRERGEGLSGGEKQAMGLARVFAKSKAKIVLLDEPSNGMDSNNEHLVTQSLRLFSTKKTLLMVSHKNNLLKGASRLILLEKGKVLLDDSHDEVMKKLLKKGKNAK